jgi:hypothetical protein
MGTKRNPGKFDCYEKAAADEPIFTLRAKDPHAPALLRRWANLVEAEIAANERPPFDIEKVNEARKCAYDMEVWRAGFTAGQPEPMVFEHTKLMP